MLTIGKMCVRWVHDLNASLIFNVINIKIIKSHLRWQTRELQLEIADRPSRRQFEAKLRGRG